MLEWLKSPQNPDAFFIVADQKISFPELHSLVVNVACFLQENQIRCLAFCVPNGLINLLAYLGGWAADITVMPINPRLKSPELIKILKQYKPSHFWVVAEKIDPLLTQACHDLNIHLSVTHPNTIPYQECLEKTYTESTPTHSIIQFTSGTLGEYKGAVHHYQDCALYAQLMSPDMRYEADERLLICLSLNHAMAFSYQLLPALYQALSCVILPAFEVDPVLSAIETYGITSISVLPTMAYLLAKTALNLDKKYPSLKKIIIAGDALPLAMRNTIVAAFGCEPIVGIGMTECYGYCLNFNPEQKPGAAGLPVAGYSFKVVDENNQDLPAGETGSILIKGPCLFSEYYQLPELTAASFYHGWFATGDLGKIDNDGYLWFQGRRKHLIISGGSNIAPLEIEAVIYEHPDILEAVVVGAPDPEYIEKVVAFIAKTADSKLTEEELMQFLRMRLADYKLPQKIYFLESLPKNATGKLDRAILAEKAKHGPMIMGICNLTHDSFTERGTGPKTVSRAFQDIQTLIAAGADIIDIGAESTGLAATGLDTEIELQLLENILDEYANHLQRLPKAPLISIDTRKLEVMRVLLDKYPFIWMLNDVEGHNLVEKAQLIAQYRVKYVLTHNLGTIGREAYLSKEHAIEQLITFFNEKITVLKQQGVDSTQIYLDVGFGFGKNKDTAQLILQNLNYIKTQLGFPLLVGHSRKPTVLGVSKDATIEELDKATAQLSLWLTKNGADILRVHHCNPNLF